MSCEFISFGGANVIGFCVWFNLCKWKRILVLTCLLCIAMVRVCDLGVESFCIVA